MEYSKLIDIASKVSLAVVLMVILIGGVQGYWVAGSTYKDMVADRNEWKELALKGANVATLAARPAITGSVSATAEHTNPLPPDASRQAVMDRLARIEQDAKYKTEPTDTPLP